MTQQQRAEQFRALHQRAGAFPIPNPWDAGSARLLEHLGFEALATTSSGLAYAKGRLDYHVTRDEVLEHLRALSEATKLPISADLENGFGDDPEICADTVRLAAEAGVVGGSIEDATGDPDGPIYCIEHAVARVRAAAEAAHSLAIPFTLTARCENFLHGRPDLNDTIGRLQAYQEAGADVLYAPGLTSEDQIRAVVSAVDRPVNVLAMRGTGIDLARMSQLGVKRVSVGGALCRAAAAAIVNAAREMKDTGSFAWLDAALPPEELTAALR